MYTMTSTYLADGGVADGPFEVALGLNPSATAPPAVARNSMYRVLRWLSVGDGDCGRDAARWACKQAPAPVATPSTNRSGRRRSSDWQPQARCSALERHLAELRVAAPDGSSLRLEVAAAAPALSALHPPESRGHQRREDLVDALVRIADLLDADPCFAGHAAHAVAAGALRAAYAQQWQAGDAPLLKLQAVVRGFLVRGGGGPRAGQRQSERRRRQTGASRRFAAAANWVPIGASRRRAACWNVRSVPRGRGLSTRNAPPRAPRCVAVNISARFTET